MVKMYIYTLVYNELCLFCISRFRFIFQCVPVWIGELNETSLLLLVHNTRFIMYQELCVIKYTFVILVQPHTHHEWVGISMVNKDKTWYDDVIRWKHFPRYWPFVRGIHRSPVNSPHKGQWRGALTFSLICVWINGWVNNREAGDLRRYLAHYDVIVLSVSLPSAWKWHTTSNTGQFMDLYIAFKLFPTHWYNLLHAFQNKLWRDIHPQFLTQVM